MNVWWAGLLAMLGLTASAVVWTQMSRHTGGVTVDRRLTVIYFAALVGALLGAKLAFFITEGWTFRDNVVALLTGRSITGALLGGYAAVELAKWKLRYRTATGDLFAIIVPLSLAIGRVGCLIAGCCPGAVCADAHWWTLADADGVPRWPAVPMELLFNAAFLSWALLAERRDWQPMNRFHIFLISYGTFRLGHEFLRDNSTWIGPIGGYHLMALLLIALGVVRYRQRSAATEAPVPEPMLTPRRNDQSSANAGG